MFSQKTLDGTQHMRNHNSLKIFFATPADIEMLGAPRSIDIPMVKALADMGYKVSWFGININACVDFYGEKISLNYSKPQRYFMRVKNKILRIFKIQTVEDQKLVAQKNFDLWLSEAFESKRKEIDKNLIFIGRGVSSELSFKTIKKYGGQCVLHSQWLHPSSHSKILEKAYFERGIKKNPTPKERLAIQLKEIDICDQVWCISKLVYDSYIKNKVPKTKLFLSPLGVDTNFFKPKKFLPELKNDKFIIVFVGNINIEKGVHILLEAIVSGKVSNCQLILNGSLEDDLFKSILEKFTNDLELLNIKLTIKSGNPLLNLQKADLFVLPSLHESFGLVVIEAMACGLPVIVTDQVGASDHVINGYNGFIIPSDSIKELADKILYFYKYRGRKKIFGRNSYKLSQKLNWPFVTKNFVNCIESKFNDKFV